MVKRERLALRSVLPVALFLLMAPAAVPQSQEPSQPLDEIVRHFAQKEEDYARAHALYNYQLRIRIQEIAEDNRVVGEFEQVSRVEFDRSGRRVAQVLENPHVDLAHLGVSRVELSDLEFVPLFILGPDDIPDYKVTYLARERLDEVNTYLFRLTPARVARPGDHLFEGIVWVDAQKLDIVRALGRTVPVRATGALNGYFRRVEIFREPVDDSLFTTFVRADDVLAVQDVPIRARLVLRFSKHERVREPDAAQSR
ncbi:MAG: hypothetical protein ACE5IP_05180 [Terriglobia bacterium]